MRSRALGGVQPPRNYRFRPIAGSAIVLESTMEACMSHAARMNFVKQQGFQAPDAAECEFRYPAAMFQPRVIGLLVFVGVFLQAWPLFLTLSAVLWWNVLVPALNPFDRFFNAFVADRWRLPHLTPAPAPRRFSQGMAATFMLVIAVSLLAGWRTVAWIMEALLLVALSALIFGRFCLGSYVFHILTGNREFAANTLPWSRSA
jgi:hypothetical protein